MAAPKRPGQRRDTPNSLTDGDIVTARGVDRRRVLTMVGASVVGATAATGCVPSGRYADGLSDLDTGAYGDPVGGGRGAGRGTGITDTDIGSHADAVGSGRGGSFTDSDTGRYADHVGNNRLVFRGDPTDTDTGPYADPADRD